LDHRWSILNHNHHYCDDCHDCHHRNPDDGQILGGQAKGIHPAVRRLQLLLFFRKLRLQFLYFGFAREVVFSFLQSQINTFVTCFRNVACSSGRAKIGSDLRAQYVALTVWRIRQFLPPQAFCTPAFAKGF
jgi:hypothetical protein